MHVCGGVFICSPCCMYICERVCVCADCVLKLVIALRCDIFFQSYNLQS